MYNADQAKRDSKIMAQRQQEREFSRAIDAIRHAVNEGRSQVTVSLRFSKQTIPKLEELGYKIRRSYPLASISPDPFAKSYLVRW